MAKKPDDTPFRLGHWLQNLFLRGLIGGLLLLPYTWRVPLCGWIVSRLIAPVAGYSRRIRDNLALIFPDMPEAEVRRMMRAVPDNVGRTLIEMYSGEDFLARARRAPDHRAGAGLSGTGEGGKPPCCACDRPFRQL